MKDKLGISWKKQTSSGQCESRTGVFLCKPGKPNLAISSNKIPQRLVSPFDIRSLKPTVCTWKWLIGRRSSPLGARPRNQVRTVSFLECNTCTWSVSIHTFCIRLLAASFGELGSPQTFSTTKSPVLGGTKGPQFPHHRVMERGWITCKGDFYGFPMKLGSNFYPLPSLKLTVRPWK